MQTQVAGATEAPKRKEMPVLMPERFGLSEAKRRDWVADVEAGRTVQDILEPSYWAHIAPQLSAGDHIEARAEDGKWIAFLIVLYCERTYARVVVDRVLEIRENAVATDESIRHKVEWKGPHYKFAVIRIADSQMLQSGFKTREEAAAWLRNHEQAG